MKKLILLITTLLLFGCGGTTEEKVPEKTYVSYLTIEVTYTDGTTDTIEVTDTLLSADNKTYLKLTGEGCIVKRETNVINLGGGSVVCGVRRFKVMSEDKRAV